MQTITDYCLWSKTQADLLRKGDFSHMDIDNMIEEIESLGNSEADKLESHLINYLMHMLKNEYQPEKRTRSWDLSIKESLMRAKRVLSKNPSLKHRLDEIIGDAFSTARLRAAKETGLEEDVFPLHCPWKLEQLLKE
jgi:molecular chaperone DnaK (HSP70)